MILDDKKAVIFDLDGTLVDSMWMWGAPRQTSGSRPVKSS